MENRAQMFTRMDGTGKMLRGLPHASLSCLIAVHDGVRTWQVRDTVVEEGGRKCAVRSRLSKAHVSVVELAAAVCRFRPSRRSPTRASCGRRKLWV